MVSPMPVHSLPRDALGAAKTRGRILGLLLIVQRRFREEGDALRNSLPLNECYSTSAPFLLKKSVFSSKDTRTPPSNEPMISVGDDPSCAGGFGQQSLSGNDVFVLPVAAVMIVKFSELIPFDWEAPMTYRVSSEK